MANWQILVGEKGALPFEVRKDDTEGYADGIIRTFQSRMMIVYYNGNLYKTESTDNAATWSAAVALVNSIVECVPAIAQDSYGRIFVYFIKTADAEEKLHRIVSTDDGATWSSPEEVTTS